MSLPRGRTVARPATLDGVGIHTGAVVRLTIRPRAEAGIVFRRTDIADAPDIPVSPEYLVDCSWSTCLGVGSATVSTVEHLLAALNAHGIWSALIEVNGPEAPIGDGSGLPFVELLQRAGAALGADADPIRLQSSIWVADGNAHIVATPASELTVVYCADYDHPLAGAQVGGGPVTPASFDCDLAPARTFALSKWIDELLASGRAAGGSLDNALVVFPDHYSSPLRLPQELARHKALDVIGDLAVLGRPLCAHVTAVKSSHRLNAQLVQAIAAQT